VVWDSSPLLFDNLHRGNEQAEKEDKLVVEDNQSASMHIGHQQRLEDKSLEVMDILDSLWGMLCGMYHQDICRSQQDMFRELGKVL
jgi:hypothetical protein